MLSNRDGVSRTYNKVYIDRVVVDVDFIIEFVVSQIGRLDGARSQRH